MINIIFLGNIGSKYTWTRHNIGFIYADKISDNLCKSFNIKKSIGGMLLETNTREIIQLLSHSSNINKELKQKIEKYNFNLKNEKIQLIKPECYMNESGKVALLVKSKYHSDKIIVVHDELDLPFGTIKYKFGGGDNGHNGLKSITSKIGSNYWRIRFGIGRPGKSTLNLSEACKDFKFSELIDIKKNQLPKDYVDISTYVLSNFSDSELLEVNNKTHIFISNILDILLN